MANNKQIHNVAIVGTGVIGASWAALLTVAKSVGWTFISDVALLNSYLR